MTDKMATPKHSSPAVKTWPRLTPVQKSMLADFGKSEYGDLHLSGLRLFNTAIILVCHGMLRQGSVGWFSITQRGRDYLRFGTRRKNHVKS